MCANVHVGAGEGCAWAPELWGGCMHVLIMQRVCSSLSVECALAAKRAGLKQLHALPVFLSVARNLGARPAPFSLGAYVHTAPPALPACRRSCPCACAQARAKHTRLVSVCKHPAHGQAHQRPGLGWRAHRRACSPLACWHAGKKVADYWDASKKLLMDSRFIERLKEYDRDNIQVIRRGRGG